MTPIPLTLQTLYQDLLQAHLDRPPPEMEGAPHLREVKGRKHWYATTRAPGGGHRQIFIGLDDAATRVRIERWREANLDARAFRSNAAEKVAALRAARLPALDLGTGKVLRALAQAGTFRLGGVLVGTHAFRLYDLELGARIASAATAVTADIDIGAFEKLSAAVDDHAAPPIPQVLTGLGLSSVPGLDVGHATRWRDPRSDLVVEFLSPAFREEEAPQRLEAFDVWAQGLHFLNFLIRDPVPAVALYREGVLVNVPRPERFAVHKLIVSGRRSGPHRAKAEKDLAQARALADALAEARPEEFARAWREARGEGDRWAELLDKALAADPAIRARIEHVSDN